MSSQLPSDNPTAYLGIQDTHPGQNWVRRRAPLPTDIHYNIGDRWIVETSGSQSFWVLGSVINKVATWISLGVGTAVESLKLDDASIIVPVSSTITLTGNATQGISTLSGGAGIAQLTIANASTSQIGVLSLASNAETIAGTVTTKAVTPDDLSAKLGTQTAHGVLVGEGTTSPITALGAGTSGYPLLSGGASTDPGYGQLNLTAGVTGVLPVANGGTGVPALYAFHAYKSATTANVTGDSTPYAFICDTEIYDLQGNYNNGTGVFTAPVTGLYLFGAIFNSSNCVLAGGTSLSVVTTSTTYPASFNVKQNDGFTNCQITALANMTAGHTAYPLATVFGEAGVTVGIQGSASKETRFWGCLIT